MKIGLNLIKHLLVILLIMQILFAQNIANATDQNNLTDEIELMDDGTPESYKENWQDQLVQDVLEQDIRQALRNSQEKIPSSTSMPQSILAPRLVALYGVGKALMAEVQVGNQAYLYIRGQTYPAGYVGDKRVYQLKAMNGACIQLEKANDKHSLCLRMLLGEALL